MGDETLPHNSEITRALLQVQDRERQRIAADLHDSIGQNLSAVKMTIETVRKDLEKQGGLERQQRALAATLTRLRITIDELRRIALDLRPSMLEELGLLATLNWFVRDYNEINPDVKVAMYLALEETDIPQALRCDLFRVIQEALHNVSKHASAKNVELSLDQEDNRLVLRISDDGCGFHLRGERGRGAGIYNMLARSERGGCHMDIDTALGTGTRITLSCPLPVKKARGTVSGDPLSQRRGIADRRQRDRRGK